MRRSPELSALRDAHATLATFDELVAATHADRADEDALARVRRGLVGRAGAAGDADAERPLAGAAERLAAVRRRVPRWSPDDDVAVLLGGLEANDALARRALGTSLHDPADESLHEWRKGAKYGWHHARLLHPVAPSVLGPMATRLKDLSDGLGDDHDLAVLRAQIVAAPRDFGGASSEHAVALIDGARADLQDRCRRLGARLYAEPAPAFRKRVGRCWAAWQALGPERPAGAIGDLASEPADRPPHAADLLAAGAR